MGKILRNISTTPKIKPLENQGVNSEIGGLEDTYRDFTKLYIISHTIHLSISPKTAEIHTLTPKGKPSITIYPIQDFTHLKINHEGNIKTQKKKRFRRNLERIGIFVSEVWVGIN